MLIIRVAEEVCMDFFEKFEKKLRGNGYKLTNQRRVVLEILYNRKGKHLTAEDIHNIVKVSNPEIGLATIYRSLQLLTELSLVDTLHLDDGIVRYEIHGDEEGHRHHHLICDKCGSITEASDDMLDEIEKNLEEHYGFKVRNHVAKFYGLCKDCIDE